MTSPVKREIYLSNLRCGLRLALPKMTSNTLTVGAPVPNVIFIEWERQPERKGPRWGSISKITAFSTAVLPAIRTHVVLPQCPEKRLFHRSRRRSFSYAHLPIFLPRRSLSANRMRRFQRIDRFRRVRNIYVPPRRFRTAGSSPPRRSPWVRPDYFGFVRINSKTAATSSARAGFTLAYASTARSTYERNSALLQ